MAASPPAFEYAGSPVRPIRWVTATGFSDSDYLDDVGVAVRSAAAGTLYTRGPDDVIQPLQFTAGETRVVFVTQLRSTSTTGITASDVEVGYAK